MVDWKCTQKPDNHRENENVQLCSWTTAFRIKHFSHDLANISIGSWNLVQTPRGNWKKFFWEPDKLDQSSLSFSPFVSVNCTFYVPLMVSLLCLSTLWSSTTQLFPPPLLLFEVLPGVMGWPCMQPKEESRRNYNRGLESPPSGWLTSAAHRTGTWHSCSNYINWCW